MQALSIRLSEVSKLVPVLSRVAKMPWRAGLKWLSALMLLSIVFLLGVKVGADVSNRSSLYAAAYNQQAVEKMRQNGQPWSSERRSARLYDSTVADYIRRREHPRLMDRVIDAFIFGTFSKVSEANAVNVRNVAEYRLANFQEPSPTSLAEMKRLAASPRIKSIFPAYDNTARDYSILLGREITPEQLLLEADVQGLLRAEQEFKR